MTKAFYSGFKMKNFPKSLSVYAYSSRGVGATLSSSSDVGAPTNKDLKK